MRIGVQLERQKPGWDAPARFLPSLCAPSQPAQRQAEQDRCCLAHHGDFLRDETNGWMGTAIDRPPNAVDCGGIIARLWWASKKNFPESQHVPDSLPAAVGSLIVEVIWYFANHDAIVTVVRHPIGRAKDRRYVVAIAPSDDRKEA